MPGRLVAIDLSGLVRAAAPTPLCYPVLQSANTVARPSPHRWLAPDERAHDDTFVPGHMSTLMSAHICAAIPNFRIMEIDVDDVPWKAI